MSVILQTTRQFVGLLALFALPLRAQTAEDRRIRALPQWEVRQDLTFAREPSAHVGALLNIRA